MFVCKVHILYFITLLIFNIFDEKYRKRIKGKVMKKNGILNGLFFVALEKNGPMITKLSLPFFFNQTFFSLKTTSQKKTTNAIKRIERVGQWVYRFSDVFEKAFLFSVVLKLIFEIKCLGSYLSVLNFSTWISYWIFIENVRVPHKF